MSLKDLAGHFMLKYLAVPRTPEIEPGKRHIACIGDSITFGAGVDGKKEKTWEYFLNEILGSDFQVINYGICGRTLQDEGDFPYKKDKFYPISLHSRSGLFLIMLGTNDAKPYNWSDERFRTELEAFVEEYMSLKNNPKVVLMTPPSCFPEEKSGIVAFDIDPDILDNHVVKIVRKTAENKGLKLIDLHSYTSEHDEWFSDGVHPNEEGNRKIAAYIADSFHKG